MSKNKGRVKKYVQSAIPAAISEKGGFTARFIGDGFSVDARTEILPKVIKEQGLQIGEEPGWALVYNFLKGCANHAATTGETVNIDSLMTFGLSIRGWFANKTSKATKENVRVTAKLLGDLRPTVNFSMSNANEGNTIMCYTATTPGCPLNHVKQGASATINGKWLKMILDDTGSDHVTAEVALSGGRKVSAECPITGSDDDHVDVTIPSAFSGVELVGKDIMFTVYGRTGDPEAGVQSATVTATLDDGGAEVRPFVTKVATAGKDGVQQGQPFAAIGGNLGSYGEGCTTTVRWTQGGEEKDLTLSPSGVAADSLTYDAVDAFDDIEAGTELAFEIAFADGQVIEKNAELLAE